MVMVLGGLLAPLRWLWYTCLFVCSHSWMLAATIALFSSAYLLYRHRSAAAGPSARHSAGSRRKIAKVVTNPTTLGQELRQVLPVHPHNGWSLDRVSHGLRIFSRFFPSLGVSHTPCLAATTIITVSPKKLLSIATNGRDIPSWLEGVSMAPQYIQGSRGNPASGGDIIQLSFRRRHNSEMSGDVVERSLSQLRQWGTNFTQKYATFLDRIFTIQTQFNTEIFEREWSIDGEGCGQVCWVARQPSELPYHWSMLVFSTSVKEKSQSVATLVMLPKSPDVQPLTSELLTSHLAALRDFSCLRRARVYPHSNTYTSEPGHVTSQGGGAGLSAHPRPHPTHSGRSLGRESPPEVPSQPQPTSKGEAPLVKDPLILVPNGPLLSSLPTPQPPATTADPQVEPHSLTSLSSAHGPSPSSPLTSSPPPISPLTNPPPPGSPVGSHYEQLGRNSCDKLVTAAQATDKDGWIPIGTNKDVFIMKKPPQKGEASVNCIKGTAIVRAPPEFVYRVLKTRKNVGKFDDMLKEARLVEEISDTTRLVHLLYKAVWPTSARDFTVVTTAGRYDDSTLVNAAVSVVDSRVAEEKGYVRGNVVCGGYVMKTVSDQPEMCEVTYVSQAELKGNIPTFAVNKVTESQPMCVGALRSVAEDTYTASKREPQIVRELEDSVFLTSIQPPLTPPTSERSLTSVREGESSVDGGVGERELGGIRSQGDRSPAAVSNESGTTRESSSPSVNEREMMNNERIESWAVVSSAPPPVTVETQEEGERKNGVLVMEAFRAYTPDDISTGGEEEEEEERETVGGDQFAGGHHQHQQDKDKEEEEEEEVERIRFEKKLQPYPLVPTSPPAVPADTESLTEESISFPRQESGGVDFRTLGNQTAARVLEELFHVSSLDMANPLLFDNGTSGWKVISVEREIVILRKKSPGTPFFSFMGRGVIELPPRKVYDSIRNPQLRFTYDNMLKELHSVKHIEDGLYILHIHHETTQCFIKQSRDFCVLANERQEGNKLLLVGLSVDIPECPVNPNITRAKLAFSGWVVEPYKIHNRMCTLVTYLLQVDLGGIPATLVNYVSKRQPLAISYLRDYLISTNPPG